MLNISSDVITLAFQSFKCFLLLLSIHMKLFHFKAYHIRLLECLCAAGQTSWWSLKLCHINSLVITVYQGAMLISQDFSLETWIYFASVLQHQVPTYSISKTYRYILSFHLQSSRIYLPLQLLIPPSILERCEQAKIILCATQHLF